MFRSSLHQNREILFLGASLHHYAALLTSQVLASSQSYFPSWTTHPSIIPSKTPKIQFYKFPNAKWLKAFGLRLRLGIGLLEDLLIGNSQRDYYNTQQGAMVRMNCSICNNPIYSCPYDHGYANLPGLIVCTPCITNGTFLNYIKSKFALIERAKYTDEHAARETAEAEVTRFREQETFNDVVIFGTLVSPRTRELAAKFVDLRDKLLREEPRMRRSLQDTVERILAGTERAVNRVITDEVEALTRKINDEDRINQKNVLRVQEMRDQNKTLYRNFQTLDLEDNPIGRLLTEEEINACVQILNAKIDAFNNKHVALQRLFSEGEAIVTYRLPPERGERDERERERGAEEEAPPVEDV